MPAGALQILASAAVRDPQNAEICDIQAQVLIGAGRHKEALAAIEEGLARLPENVYWRERAIKLFVDSGDNDAAIRAAREGIAVYPRRGPPMVSARQNIG